MRREILACWVLSGCGFKSNAGPGGPFDAPVASDAPVADARPGDAAGDAAAGDAAVDAAGDASKPQLTCWQHWLAHDVALQAPAELTQISSSGAERDPWISKDGLRLYFAREPGAKGMSDIYLATRGAVTQPFDDAAEVTNLNTLGQDSRAALTENERILVLASDRNRGRFEIYITTRNDTVTPFGSPDQSHLGNVNGSGSSVSAFDPFLTADGTKLYFAPDPNGSAPQHISLATRGGVDLDFSNPAPLASINTTESADDADPALSLDERVIVFSSARSGGEGAFDLYYATRADPGQDFGAPIQVPGVNAGGDDADPMLSADGCDLYFASTRNGGDLDLFVARVAP